MDEQVSLEKYLEWLDWEHKNDLWFEIDGNGAGQLARHIRSLIYRIDALEKALQFYECGCKQDSCTPEKPKFRNIRCGWIARAALAGERKDG